jgi:predicted NBD/HSP70 family sugar kinase
MKKNDMILEVIFKEGPLFREKIIDKSGIGSITIGKIIKNLIEEGKIVKDGKIISGRGRSKSLYKVNPDLYYIEGISFDGSKFIVGVTDLEGKIIYKFERKFETENQENFISEINSIIEKVEKDLKTKREKIINIGFSFPGTIDIKKGEILGLCNWENWDAINLKKIFKKNFYLFDIPDVLARAEYEIRKGERIKNLIYIYLGEGIGLGVVLNGKLYYGSTGNFGEIGHIIVNENGERCYCGNYGCLEKFAGMNSIIENVKEGIKEGVHSEIGKIIEGDINKIDIEKIKIGIEKGDKLCFEVIEKAGKYVGKVSALLVNIFNPEIIVFGGLLTQVGDTFLSTIKYYVKKEALPILCKDLKIEFSNMDEKEGIIKGTSLTIIDIMKEDKNLFNLKKDIK